jgi:hypothetical protein
MDTERIFSYRALRIARNDKTPLAGFEQDDYVKYGPFAQSSLTGLLQEFTSVRNATLALFRALDEAAWTRRGSGQQQRSHGARPRLHDCRPRTAPSRNLSAEIFSGAHFLSAQHAQPGSGILDRETPCRVPGHYAFRFRHPEEDRTAVQTHCRLQAAGA